MPKKKQVANHNIKLLLNETIRHLGKVGDVVEVKPGYARNYLLPHGLAMMPTPDNLKRIEAKRKEYERIEAEQRTRQQGLLAALENYEVVLERKVNERGHLYGSVSASDLARALREAGFGEKHDVEIEAGDINLHGKIDHIGTFTFDIRFTDELMQELKVTVNADEESKAAMEEYRRDQKAREQAAAKAEAAEAAAQA
jgi:large subunit ribosomal protein L9